MLLNDEVQCLREMGAAGTALVGQRRPKSFLESDKMFTNVENYYSFYILCQFCISIIRRNYNPLSVVMGNVG